MKTILPTELLTSQQEAFLEDYAEHGVVQKALNRVRASRAELREWCKCEFFKEALDDARLASVEAAEGEMRRRGMGYEVPILFQGQPVYKRDPRTGEVLLDDDFNPIPYTQKQYSDRLLEKYLEANDQKYSKKTAVELTGKNGAPIESEINLNVTYTMPEGKTEDDYSGES